MRLTHLLSFLSLSGGLWAATISGIPLGPSSTPITFGVGGAVSVGACGAGASCDLSGTVTVSSVALNWTLTLTNSLTLVGTPSGNTAAGTMTIAPATLLVSDSLGDTISGTTTSLLTWTSSPTLTTFNLNATLSAVSITSLFGTTVLDADFGGVPTVGENVKMSLNISCGESGQCVQSADPIGTVVGGTVTNSSTPEPASIGLTAAGLGVLFLLRRRIA